MWLDVALGVVYVVVGFIARQRGAATATGVLVVSIMMVIAGAAEVINAFRSRLGPGLPVAAAGRPYIVAGFATFKILLAAAVHPHAQTVLVISGIMRIILAFSIREEHSGSGSRFPARFSPSRLHHLDALARVQPHVSVCFWLISSLQGGLDRRWPGTERRS
jgi:uncharacterized membrane protein HdeD (DUF308 family)